VSEPEGGVPPPVYELTGVPEAEGAAGDTEWEVEGVGLGVCEAVGEADTVLETDGTSETRPVYVGVPEAVADAEGHVAIPGHWFWGHGLQATAPVVSENVVAGHAVCTAGQTPKQ